MFEKGKFEQTKKDQEPFSFFRNFFSVTEVFCAQEDCQQLGFHSWSDSAREESDYPWRWGISPLSHLWFEVPIFKSTDVMIRVP